MLFKDVLVIFQAKGELKDTVVCDRFQGRQTLPRYLYVETLQGSSYSLSSSSHPMSGSQP